MSSPASFQLFTQLPPELQLKVWHATGATAPSVHLLDVCFPSWRGPHRTYTAFLKPGASVLDGRDEKRWIKYKDTVFLDVLDISDEELARPTRVARHRVDPSMFKFRHALAATCVDAASTVAFPPPGGNNASDVDINTFYLPGRNQHVRYNNSTDVLHLRFRDGGAVTAFSQEAMLNMPDFIFDNLATAADDQPRDAPIMYEDRDVSGSNGISAVLESVWSSEMAQTMQSARRIALDVVETWTDTALGSLIIEEIAFLACTVQHNLEVLYLVDYCAGRCRRCGKDRWAARDLQTRGGMDKDLHGVSDEERKRSPDVFCGVGKTYHEVFDLEKLGWNEQHPTYVFARIIDEAIRSQQAEDPKGTVPFRGVRILVARDEEIEGLDTSIIVDCDHDGALDYPQGKIWGMNAFAEI